MSAPHFHKPDEDCYDDCPPITDEERTSALAEWCFPAEATRVQEFDGSCGCSSEEHLEARHPVGYGPWKQYATEIPVSQSMLDDRPTFDWDEAVRKSIEKYQEILERQVFGDNYWNTRKVHLKPRSKSYLWYYRRIRNPASHLRDTWRYFRGRHDCDEW